MSPLHVLVVDDSKIGRSINTRIVQRSQPEGMIVVPAATIAQGIAEFRRLIHVGLHAVLLDFRLDGGEGRITSIPLYRQMLEVDEGIAAARTALYSGDDEDDLRSDFAAVEVPFPLQYFNKFDPKSSRQIEQWLGSLPIE